MRVGHWAVRHHGAGGQVVLVVVAVQEHGLLPEVVALARVRQLRDVELRRVHLDEVHELVWLVLGEQDAELGVHAGVRALLGQAGVEQADQLLEVAVLLVVRDQLLQVVWVDDDVHGGDLGATELLRGDARDVDLLPDFRVVGLPRRLDRLGVLPELHEAGRELRVVGDRVVEQLRGLEVLLLVQAVANGQAVRRVGAADELLHLGQAIGLGVRVNELGVDHLVLCLGASHDQEAHQFLVVLLPLGRLDDVGEVARVLGLQIRLDGLWDLSALELRLAQLVPHGAVVDPRRELRGAVDGFDVGEQGVHGLGVEVALLVDQEGLLVEVVRLAQRNLGDGGPVVLVEAVDVVHHARLVRLDRGEDQEVLQIPVLAELRSVHHDLLQELDELVGELGRDESLDGARDFLGVPGVLQRSADHLVDDLAAVLVIWLEHQRPELWVLALDQVLGLQPEQAVLVRDVDQLLVAGAVRALVGRVREVRVAVLAVLPDDGGVVEGVGLQELLGVAVRVDVDHRDAVVQVGVLVALRNPRLEPRQQHAQAVPLLDLDHERLDGAGRSHVLEQVLDEVL
mmetsp:Transcript_1325/g.3676  ORF Transcript_1325/g.3676 Transcript_1325/m.3676 type:complete len:568 (+) Transcript_1325:983-2686(+)